MEQEIQKLKEENTQLKKRLDDMFRLLIRHTHSGLESSARLDPREINAISINANSYQLSGTTIINSNGIKISNLASAPSSPSLGQIYYNTGDNKFYGWNGAAWKQLDNV